MIYDMTDYNNTIISLSTFLDVSENNILDFISRNRNADVIDFLKEFTIQDDQLLEKDIELVSLHSTASIDNCQSIKEKGIINLQEVVTQETPLKKYLENKNIQINTKEKYILFKGDKIDISKRNDSYSFNEEEKFKNGVIHKLYNDFQINGFLTYDDVLTYDGYTRDRPEILFNLAKLFKDEKIEKDWNNNNEYRHYIIKFKLPLDYYQYWTFQVEDEDSDYGITKENYNYLSNIEKEIKLKKWVIQKSIANLEYGFSELYSYVKPDVKIDNNNILEIMTEKDFMFNYDIDNNN